MILLDTNALLWLDQEHPRGRALSRWAGKLYVSPATLLELQILVEAGKMRQRRATVTRVIEDDRWTVDDPPAVSWFRTALELGWTREPLDRLIVAHARLRGWRLATGDAALLAHLRESERIEV